MGQHQNSVGHRDRFLDVMGDQEDRFSAVADKIDGVALDQELGLEIKRGKGFIEKQNVGVVDESASERHALAHAPRQGRGIIVGEAVQAQLIKKRARALVGLRFRHVPDLHAKFDVGDRGSPRQKQILLQHIADVGGSNATSAELLAMPANFARVRRE